MYQKRDGIDQDEREGEKWYRKAAEQGEAKAQSNLGGMYGDGHGVLQDNIYAHMWWNIAASNGNVIAVENRNIVAKRMTPADLSKAQERARECVKKNYKGC